MSIFSNNRILQRFLASRTAVIGSSLILVFILLAIFSMLIIPDKSINANNQIPSLSLSTPGSKTICLLARKNTIIESKSAISRFFNGSEEKFIYIPIQNFELEKNQLTATLTDGSIQYFHLPDIIYPLKSVNGINYFNDRVSFQDIYDQSYSASIEELFTKVNEEHIKELKFILGSDRYGRDVFSRLILGIRVSLLVGMIAVIISLFIGITIGSIGGYFGGIIDQAVMLLINTSWSIPTLLLVFAIVLALGRGIGIIFLAVGLTMWVDVARIVRGEVKKIKQLAFIDAARTMGQSSQRIILQHVLPNIIGPVLVITAANFAIAILLEAGLSFLGFGVKPPAPSLGNLLNENYGYALSGKIWLAIIPAMAIMLLVLSFNLVGSGLRDAYDIRTQKR